MTQANPRPLGDENRHYWLAVAMAKATGTDLQAALDEGRLSHADWAALVTRCRGCDWAKGCECWLAKQEPGAAGVPATCVNASVFEGLHGGQDDD